MATNIDQKADDPKVLNAQWKRMSNEDLIASHNTIPDRSQWATAPPAQGPNLSKEEAEYAANVAANKKADDLPEEKIPAPVQGSSDPLVEPGKPKA